MNLQEFKEAIPDRQPRQKGLWVTKSQKQQQRIRRFMLTGNCDENNSKIL